MFTLQSHVLLKNGKKHNIELLMDSCVAAGYTGRDQHSVASHIDELKKLGVTPPYSIPALYWISPARLTQQNSITVIGKHTSPEVEFFLAADRDGQLYVSVASDHTDRELETISVAKAKQICDKVIGDTFWQVSEIESHWDDIQLSSKVLQDDKWQEYQKGTLKDILPYQSILTLLQDENVTANKSAILSGTIPLLGGEPVYSTSCKITLLDPILQRKITKTYSIIALPDRS